MSAAEEGPLRILYAIAGYGEDHMAGLVHREMALEMRGRGHEYEIAVPAPRPPRADAFEEGVPVHRLRCAGRPDLDAINLVTRGSFRIPWFVTFAFRLRRFLRSAPRPDVVIAEGAYPLGAVAALATRRFSIPNVVSVAGAEFLASEEANYGYARYAVPRRLTRWALRRAAVVRAISPYAGQGAIEVGCPPEKLALVPRNIARPMFLPAGVDRTAFRQAARARIAARFGLGAARLVVAAGRLLPIKGFDVLVRALPELVAAAGDVRLLLAGPNRVDSRFGDYRRHLESLAGSLGVASRLTFAGSVPLEEVRELLAAADVVAVPSLEEGGNKTVLEAAATGTPFVVTSTTGNAEWAREWNCGIVVAPSSAAALADGIRPLLLDPLEAEAMGGRGLRFAQEFRSERVADRMLALCRVAVAGAPLPAELRSPLGLLHPGEDGSSGP